MRPLLELNQQLIELTTELKPKIEQWCIHLPMMALIKCI